MDRVTANAVANSPAEASTGAYSCLHAQIVCTPRCARVRRELDDRDAANRDGHALPESIGYLGDTVDLPHQGFQIAASTQFDVVRDRIRHGRGTGEVAVDGDVYGVEFYVEPRSLTEEIVRDTSCDGQVEELAAVEAFAAPPASEGRSTTRVNGPAEPSAVTCPLTVRVSTENIGANANAWSVFQTRAGRGLER